MSNFILEYEESLHLAKPNIKVTQAYCVFTVDAIDTWQECSIRHSLFLTPIKCVHWVRSFVFQL